MINTMIVETLEQDIIVRNTIKLKQNNKEVIFRIID